MVDSKQIVVAFLTRSSDSSVTDFVNAIAKELPEHICKRVQLSNHVLEPFHVQRSEGYDAVVLLHSVQEGRNAITDVPDAKYDEILPQLKTEYGAGRVAIIVHSMPSLQKLYNKDAMMSVFQDSQPTTFKCSECVIQCNNLQAMDDDDRRKLISFLNEVPNSPLPELKKEMVERSTKKNEEAKGKENCDNPVALLHHSGPDISDTSELSRDLKAKFTDYTFESLGKESVESIHHFKVVLVLVDEKDYANEIEFARLTTVYSTKIAPEGHLGWLILKKTVESVSIRDCDNFRRIFVYSRKHDKYIFEESTLNDMKEWFTKDCRLVPKTKPSIPTRIHSWYSTYLQGPLGRVQGIVMDYINP